MQRVWKSESISFEPIYDVSVPIPSKTGNKRVSLGDCLQEFTKEEVIDGDNQLFCRRCGKKCNVSKQLHVHRFPQVLVLHLKRFGLSSDKIQTAVHFPVTDLDVRSLAHSASILHDDRGGHPVFDLVGVVNHIGRASKVGHYNVDCVNEHGEWIHLNDDEVEDVDSLHANQAYMFFYEQRKTSATRLASVPDIVETPVGSRITPSRGIGGHKKRKIGAIGSNGNSTSSSSALPVQDEDVIVETPAGSRKYSANVTFNRLNELRKYKAKHGHVDVKTSHDKSLYNWCLRVKKKEVELNSEQLAQLKELGFDWNFKYNIDVNNTNNKNHINNRLKALKEYKAKHGHVNVRAGQDQSLYDWCLKVKKEEVKLNTEQLAQLEELGFDWTHKRNMSIDQRLKALRKYKAKHGHVDVQQRKDQSLYEWCLRVKKEEVKLNTEQLAQLEELGFDWTHKRNNINANNAQMKQSAKSLSTVVDECGQQLQQLKNGNAEVAVPQLPEVRIEDIVTEGLALLASNTGEDDSDQGVRLDDSATVAMETAASMTGEDDSDQEGVTHVPV